MVCYVVLEFRFVNCRTEHGNSSCISHYGYHGDSPGIKSLWLPWG